MKWPGCFIERMEVLANASTRRWWIAVYSISVALLLTCIAGFYHPAYGFTRLLSLGDHQNQTSIEGLGCYIEPDSDGNDGQYYAKIALNPLLRNGAGNDGIDSRYYRSRRILTSWTAWLLGFGRPGWILELFALQNVACWLILAVVLIRWFPPESLNNYLRWAGVLFSCGMVISVRSSFVDGPALLLIALAVNACERGKRGWAGTALTLASLERETSVLALCAIVDPSKHSLRDVGKLFLRACWIVGPLACWMIYLALHIPHGGDAAGIGNFDMPFAGFLRKWSELLSAVFAGHMKVWRTLLTMLALTTQAVFLMIKRDWKEPWWRVGAAFAVMMFFLGKAVWEGLPGADPRVLLPMTLAFNVLVPRGGRWWVLLLVGNLSVIYAPIIMPSAPKEMAFLLGSKSMLVAADGTHATLRFGEEWHEVEKRRFGCDAARWSAGSATVTIHSPHAFVVQADLSCTLNSKEHRPLALVLNGREIWRDDLAPDVYKELHIHSQRLEPGDNHLLFVTQNVESSPSSADRGRAFCLRDLRVTLHPSN